MHALFIHQFFTTPENHSGTRHYEFFTRLKKNGFRFTVIASNEWLGSARTATENIERPCDIVGVPSLPLGDGNYVWRVISFISYMLLSIVKGLYVKDVDVVIGTSPSLFQGVSAFVIALIKRKPFLLEIRDLWPAFAIDIGLLKSPVLIRLAEWLEKFLYRKADHIVVNSPAYVSYIADRGIPKSKITLVPNGVDVDSFSVPSISSTALLKDQPIDYRAQWNVDSDKFLVVYAGAIRLANNLDLLVSAAEYLQKIKSKVYIAVVGEGRERIRLSQRVGELRLSNINFYGPLPKTAMPSVIAAADACYAGLRDIKMFTMTYPNKVFDYMAGGRATVLAIDGVIREVIEACDGGIFVSPSDPVAIGNAMNGLAMNPQQTTEMGHRAHAYVRTEFNRNDHAIAFGTVLKTLARCSLQMDNSSSVATYAEESDRRVA